MPLQPVYSERLSQGHSGSSKDIDVPTGYVIVIRSVVVFNSSGVSDATFHMFESTTSITLLQWSLAPASWQDFSFRIVLDDPSFVVQFTNDGTIDYWASGYRLTLP